MNEARNAAFPAKREPFLWKRKPRPSTGGEASLLIIKNSKVKIG